MGEGFSLYGSVLVLDANGVIRNTREAKQIVLAQTLDLPRPHDQPFTRDYVADKAPERLGLFDYVRADLHLMPEFHAAVKPMQGVKESIRRLYDEDIPLAVCSTRGGTEMGSLHKWLRDNGLWHAGPGKRYFREIVPTNGGDKLGPCRRIGAWGIVDDSPEKIAHIPVRKFGLNAQPLSLDDGIEYHAGWTTNGRLTLAERIIELYRKDFR